jgi:phosphoribosylglycinamide formyltransferase-1
MKNIAIFASGNGSNAENIIRYFKNKYGKKIKVNLIVTNNKNAFVIKRASSNDIDIEIITKKEFTNIVRVLELLSCYKIDLIVLAGFLLLVPKYIIDAYSNKIVNIHPALLPNYGGKGMYGMNVHKSVIENNEKESGITIHYVNEKYDKGDIIFQARCNIDRNDSPGDLADKIHILEFENFPKVIEEIILNNN